MLMIIAFQTAVSNFRPDSVLGDGGFGSVFKGWMYEQSFIATKPGTGIGIAVKKLHQESFQGHREWQVRLFSFCFIFDR
ncbi:putative transferase [Helianthus debilis subsp. tardiflorus]